MPAKFKVQNSGSFVALGLVLSVLLSAASFGQAASAAKAPATAPANAGALPTRIGLVNVLQAIQTTNEGQKELEDLAKRFTPRQTELRTLSDEIDRLKKQLEAQAGKVTDEERSNQVRAIEAKQKVLQRNYEDAQAEFQQAQQDISGRIYQKMAAVLEKYASSQGFALVLDISGQQSSVLWGNQGTLITQELVDAYNAQSPVPPPKAPASGAQVQPSGGTGAPAAQAPAAAATPKKP